MTVRFADLTCHAHGGVWGADPTCQRCTDDDGETLPFRVYTTDPGVSRLGREMKLDWSPNEVAIEADAATGEVIEDEGELDPAVYLRAVHLQARLLAEGGREGEAEALRRAIPDEWLEYLDAEQSQYKVTKNPGKRAWVGPFLLGLFAGWSLAATGILGTIIIVAVSMP